MNASPYREEKQAPIKSLFEIMGGARYNLDGPVVKNGRVKGPRNERDELFDFFYAKVAPAWLAYTKKPLRKAYLAMKISHLKERDLFFIKSVCIDAENRGQSFSKVFWGSLKPRPEDVHTLPDRKG